MPEIKPANYSIISVLFELGFAASKSDARRIINQKGIKINKVVVRDPDTILKKNDIIQKGKRFFAKII